MLLVPSLDDDHVRPSIAVLECLRELSVDRRQLRPPHWANMQHKTASPDKLIKLYLQAL